MAPAGPRLRLLGTRLHRPARAGARISIVCVGTVERRSLGRCKRPHFQAGPAWRVAPYSTATEPLSPHPERLTLLAAKSGVTRGKCLPEYRGEAGRGRAAWCTARRRGGASRGRDAEQDRCWGGQQAEYSQGRVRRLESGLGGLLLVSGSQLAAGRPAAPCCQRGRAGAAGLARRPQAVPNSTERTCGRLPWYAMRRRSSSVLEHTILPSALVTTTPPQLQGGSRGMTYTSEVQARAASHAAAAAPAWPGAGRRQCGRAVPIQRAGRQAWGSQERKATKGAASPRLELVVVRVPPLLGRRRQRVRRIQLHLGAGRAVNLLVLGLMMGRGWESRRVRGRSGAAAAASCRHTPHRTSAQRPALPLQDDRHLWTVRPPRPPPHILPALAPQHRHPR